MKKYLLLSFLILQPLLACADAIEIVGVCYNLDSSGDAKTASVTKKDNKYYGEVIIPSFVTYEGLLDVYANH